MSRQFDTKTFNRFYNEAVVAGRFNEAPDYYPRYRARYRTTLRKYAQVADVAPARVLDIGGGQHAFWSASASPCDLGA
jgi:hypothetical protein